MSSNKKRAQNHIDKMKVELISNIISACTKPITKNLLFFVFMYILGLFISTVEGTICTRLCLELFIELYLYCTCLALLPPSLSHTLRIISYILLYLLSLIEIWFYLNMDTTISPTLLQLALQTNINESSEAINSYLSFKSIKLPIIFIVIIIITNIISSYFCRHLNDFFSKTVYSFTKNSTYSLTLSKKYISEADNVLIIDDFLANGEASLGVVDIIKEANANVAGIGIVIEKSFQPGRKKLESMGYHVYSLARIKSMKPEKIEFLKEE